MIVTITDIHAPEIDVYARLTESQLRSRLDPTKALFIAESPKVIRVALDKGYTPVSMLCERRHITGNAADIVERVGDIPIYTGDAETLKALTGYDLTRGVLCAMSRPEPRPLDTVCQGARRIVVINGVAEATNVGAIFRSAAALGIDAVVLTRNACDPLIRRAVRVSMGSVFLVPWTQWMADDAALYAALRQMGFRTAAMALTDKSVSVDDPVLATEPRLAIVMGTEGDGLPQESIDDADYVVRIPMAHGVDSLNVAAASAVAFWQITR